MRSWAVLMVGWLWLGGVRSAPEANVPYRADLSTEGGYNEALYYLYSYYDHYSLSSPGHEARRDRDRLLPNLVCIIETDHDARPEAAHWATRTLGFLGLDAPVEPLRRMMRARGRQRELRSRAASTAGETGNPAFVPDLLSLLAEAESTLAPSAASALGWLGAGEAVPALIRTLGETKEAKLARACIRALGRIASPLGRAPIEAWAAAHPDDAEAAPAIKVALERIRLLTGPDRAQRLAALACPANEAPTPPERLWFITQIARLRLTELTATLRASLDRRTAYVASRWPAKKGRLDTDDTAFELAKALYQLGGQLRDEELKVLKEEHLIAADGTPRW